MSRAQPSNLRRKYWNNKETIIDFFESTHITIQSAVCRDDRLTVTNFWEICRSKKAQKSAPYITTEKAKKRRQTPRISGENFTISHQRFASSQCIIAAYSKFVLVPWLKVWNATLRIVLDPSRFGPYTSADVLHLYHVMFNLQPSVVHWWWPRQMATVFVNVEYFQWSFRF